MFLLLPLFHPIAPGRKLFLPGSQVLHTEEISLLLPAAQRIWSGRFWSSRVTDASCRYHEPSLGIFILYFLNFFFSYCNWTSSEHSIRTGSCCLRLTPVWPWSTNGHLCHPADRHPESQASRIRICILAGSRAIGVLVTTVSEAMLEHAAADTFSRFGGRSCYLI